MKTDFIWGIDISVVFGMNIIEHLTVWLTPNNKILNLM